MISAAAISRILTAADYPAANGNDGGHRCTQAGPDEVHVTWHGSPRVALNKLRPRQATITQAGYQTRLSVTNPAKPTIIIRKDPT